ncbi:hypothetical protein DMC30DRAFT_444909 [Rhodotorula diobovata]|uniref:Uncharacterized protein n=1 Tax=Rhodotorula diobovata TaxID=5288 RepID=A0A5C5G3G6_9BASI|nr:hypothetical protein DMC30DRAFT_444909 [Rhodotorula diobovata]
MAAYERCETDDFVEQGGLAAPPPRRLSLQLQAYLRLLNWTYAGWVVAAFLLVHSVWRGSTGPLPDRGDAEACFDPFRSPGYIFRPSNLSIRHVPFPPSASLDDLTSSTAIEDAIDPPDDVLSLAAPAYGDMLNEKVKPSELAFARDQSVWFIGDSHDRMNLEVFCRQHEAGGAVLDVPHWHIKANCRFPDLNLTFASFFHYGLAPESDSLPPDAWNIPALPSSRENENPPPYSVEGRLREFWVPAVSEVGRPSMIVLNSFFWDLRYFALYAEHFNHHEFLRRKERPLTYSELAWHRSRVRVLVEAVREAFPGVPIMFRLGQAHQTNRNEGNVEVFQLNESLRAVLAKLDVPIFEWASLLTGESRYADDQHLQAGAPARLYADMAMYYLRRAVTGWDRCDPWPASTPHRRASLNR